MSTVHVDLYEAIVTRFKDQVEGPQSLKVVYDNEPERPGATSQANRLGQVEERVWARFTVREGDSVQASSGASSNRHRTVGVATAQLFQKVGTGTLEARTLADVVKTKFQSLTFSGITFRTPSIQNVGQSGGYWQINVTCPFYTDDYA